MSRVILAAAVLGTGFVLLAAAGCSDETEITPDSQDPVRIEISPSSGTIGTEVTIRGSGFDADRNDVGFDLGADAGSFKAAFVNDIPSTDGKTLRFKLEETLGACAMTQLEANSACPAIGLLVPVGEVRVHNRNGTSRSVRFTREISRLEAATKEIDEAPEYARLSELLNGIVGASRQPFSGEYTASASWGIHESEEGDIYIDVEIRGTDVSGIKDQIPSEIAGYEVRLTAPDS